MKCIQASQVEPIILEQFLECNKEIQKTSLIERGYVVEWKGKIIGCFELDVLEKGVYWLRQLYIIQNEAAKLPMLLEYILIYAKKKNASCIYAHSEQPVTDLLLQSLQFSLQTEQIDLLRKQSSRKGNWWTYKVG